jgi:hypothetical protein
VKNKFFVGLHGDKTESEKPKKGPAMCETYTTLIMKVLKATGTAFPYKKTKVMFMLSAQEVGQKNCRVKAQYCQ